MSTHEIARSTSERGELVLRAHRSDTASQVLELRANGVFVMDTAETTTEEELARTALERCADPSRVLVGGLGLGSTLRAVLADPRVRTCTVVEIEPDLVGWLREELVPGGASLLADERVEVVVGDVADVLAGAAASSYDLVLLDVDNGPGHLVHATNAALYDVPALRRARAALATGGVLVVWSADESPQLGAALAEVFHGAVAVLPLAVRLQAREEHYWLHVAERRPQDLLALAHAMAEHGALRYAPPLEHHAPQR